MNKVFKAQSPFEGYPLFFFVYHTVFYVALLLFAFWLLTVPTQVGYGIAGTIVMLLLLVSQIDSYRYLSKMQYVLTDSSIEILPKSRNLWGRFTQSPVQSIPFNIITSVETTEPAKNIFEGLFSKTRARLALKGTAPFSLTSTQTLRNAVILYTNFGVPLKVTYVISPKDKENFIRELKARLKKTQA